MGKKTCVQVNGQANTVKKNVLLFNVVVMFLWIYARSGGWIHKKLWGGNMCFKMVAGSLI